MDSDITQSAWFYRLWSWGEAHRKQIAIGITALAAIGLVAAFINWRANEKEAAANAALFQVTSQSASPAPDKLLMVANDFRNSESGARALLLAATGFFNDGKFADAETQFRKFLGDYPSSTFRGQALLGIAACLEAQGKTNDAITAYQTVSSRGQMDLIAAQAKFSMARLQQAQGKLEQARDLFFEVATKSSPQISLGAQAQSSYQELIASHPELVKTNRTVTLNPGTVIPPGSNSVAPH